MIYSIERRKKKFTEKYTDKRISVQLAYKISTINRYSLSMVDYHPRQDESTGI